MGKDQHPNGQSIEKTSLGKKINKASHRAELISIWTLFGILISLNVLYRYSELIAFEFLMSISLVLTLGALSILITHLVAQKIMSEDEIERTEKFKKKIDDQNKQIVENYESIMDKIRGIQHPFNALEYIVKENDPIFRKVAFLALEKTQEFTERAIHGEVKYDYLELREIVIESVTLAENDVKATHYCSKRELLTLWKTDITQSNYLKANFLAVKRGIRFERMFIINRQMLTNEETCKTIIEIFDEHQQGGINDFVLFEDDYGSCWEEDLVIVDGNRLHIYYWGKGHLFENVAVVVNKQQIEKYTDIYERAKLRASQWDTVKEDILNVTKK